MEISFRIIPARSMRGAFTTSGTRPMVSTLTCGPILWPWWTAMPCRCCSTRTASLSTKKAITDLIRPGSTLYLGTWSDGGRYFVGDLDDIVIYGRALTPTEISALYAQPAPSNLR